MAISCTAASRVLCFTVHGASAGGRWPDHPPACCSLATTPWSGPIACGQLMEPRLASEKPVLTCPRAVMVRTSSSQLRVSSSQGRAPTNDWFLWGILGLAYVRIATKKFISTERWAVPDLGIQNYPATSRFLGGGEQGCYWLLLPQFMVLGRSLSL